MSDVSDLKARAQAARHRARLAWYHWERAPDRYIRGQLYREAQEAERLALDLEKQFNEMLAARPRS